MQKQDIKTSLSTLRAPQDPDAEEHLEHITCPYCHNTLVLISKLTGEVCSPPLERKPCIACLPYQGLRDDVQNAQVEFDRLKSRRKEHTGRREALWGVVDAKKKYTNFLLKLEKVGENGEEEETMGQSTAMTPCLRVERAHSLSPTRLGRSETVLQTETGRIEANSQGKKRARSASPTLLSPHSPKRRRQQFKKPTDTKCVSFGPDVQFSPFTELRVSQEFQRGHEEYVRGRFAVWGATSYLDTSGYVQNFKDFYRQKWDGKRWVEIPDSEEEYGAEDENWEESTESEHGEMVVDVETTEEAQDRADSNAKSKHDGKLSINCTQENGIIMN